MGRSSETIAHWQGLTAEVRALLEATEIVLRGGIRARVPRASINSMSVDQGDLLLGTERGPLVLELGEVEAPKWLAALQKPVPTLAEKLGVSPGCLAFVLGGVEDAELAAALRGAVTADLGRAGVLVVVLSGPADLAVAFDLAASAPELGVWCVYPKGRASAVTDAIVRVFPGSGLCR